MRAIAAQLREEEIEQQASASTSINPRQHQAPNKTQIGILACVSVENLAAAHTPMPALWLRKLAAPFIGMCAAPETAMNRQIWLEEFIKNGMPERENQRIARGIPLKLTLSRAQIYCNRSFGPRSP